MPSKRIGLFLPPASYLEVGSWLGVGYTVEFRLFRKGQDRTFVGAMRSDDVRELIAALTELVLVAADGKGEV